MNHHRKRRQHQTDTATASLHTEAVTALLLHLRTVRRGVATLSVDTSPGVLTIDLIDGTFGGDEHADTRFTTKIVSAICSSGGLIIQRLDGEHPSGPDTATERTSTAHKRVYGFFLQNGYIYPLSEKEIIETCTTNPGIGRRTEPEPSITYMAAPTIEYEPPLD